jgi:hypothetical protein
VFNQASRNVVLNWKADNTNYGNGKWVIYRNGTKIATVPQGIYIYVDQNPSNNAADNFPYESNVKYYIYYVAKGWAETVQRSELKSNEVTVNTARKVPISGPNAECKADRIVFTWASDGYPQGWGNQFKIYVDNETTPIYTITPTAGQTSFRWEHRATDKHNDRQSGMDGTIHYTEEPLNACSPHTYRIEGVIGNKVFSTMTYKDRAIGTGTLFYTFNATKGVYPGTVKLSWHVNRQGSTTAKTYIVDRRRTEKEDEEWTNLYRTSTTDEYLFYTDDTPLPGVYYDYRVTVEDKCNNGKTIPNDITDIGFAQTTGTMSGRITFGATGSSVANVDVEARRTGASDNAEAQYHAMRFTDTNGAVTWAYPSTTYAADKFTGDFSVQMWIYPESLGEAKIVRLNGENCYIGMSASGRLSLKKYEGVYVFENALLTPGQYNHVVLTRSGTTVTASVVGSDEAGVAVLNSSTMYVEGDWMLTGATQLTVGHFIGYVDEFRLWTKVLTEAEILENYDHLLVGNEKNLETYWTFDEGLRTQFFDYSRDGTVYHQHHGRTSDGNAEPSNLTPTELKLKAKTDRDGNYIIQGVPFSGEGTTYAVVPTLGIHQFNPTQQLRFVGNNSLVHNGTDIIKAQQGVAYYSDGRWMGSLKTLMPGKGYKISTNATNVRTFSYPSTTPTNSRRAKSDEFSMVNGQSSMVNGQSSAFTPVDYCIYPSNMVLIAQVVGHASQRDNSQPLAGIELGIFAGDECREAAITDENGMVYITIPGDEPCELTFRVADGNSEFVISNSELRYETDAVIGTPSAPFVIDLGQATGIAEMENGRLKIENVYDLQGRKIVNRKFVNSKFNKGVYIVNGQKIVK